MNPIDIFTILLIIIKGNVRSIPIRIIDNNLCYIDSILFEKIYNLILILKHVLTLSCFKLWKVCYVDWCCIYYR